MSSPTLLPIASVAESLTGKRPSPPTSWRVVHRGTAGQKLKAIFVHGQWCCTREDYLDFLERVSAAKLTPTPPGPVNDDAGLVAAGLL